MKKISAELLKKYDVPAPRYTSYPTVPYWSDSPSSEQWIAHLKAAVENLSNANQSEKSKSWSLYLHIPFCETLCTYCGCNTIITKDHGREVPYIQLLDQELDAYLRSVPDLAKIPLSELHLGGGTPTFLKAEHLSQLISTLLSKLRLAEDFEASIEVDPRHTDSDQLKELSRLGFRRVSLGVQDFNHEVQHLVHRIQPFELTQKCTMMARDYGFHSVNFDLIYGLPKQSLDLMKHTVQKTLELKPDRIALYSLAVVPWIKPAQRLFKDEDLPNSEDKRLLYEYARNELTQAGYLEIGMDHFALPTDSMAISMKKQTLHRNFMGYAARRTDILLGLGVSSISETPTCFHQNEKVFNVYQRKVQEGVVPTFRGHQLTREDQFHREEILKLMTEFQLKVSESSRRQELQQFLSSAFQDQLVEFQNELLVITEKGRPFLRNICMAFDARLRQQKPETRIFSQAI